MAAQMNTTSYSTQICLIWQIANQAVKLRNFRGIAKVSGGSQGTIVI